MVALTHTTARSRGDRCFVSTMMALDPVDISATSLPLLASRVQTGTYLDHDGTTQICVPIQRVTIRIPGHLVAIDHAEKVVHSRNGAQFAFDADLVVKRRIILLGAPGWALTYFVTRSEGQV